MQVIRSADRPFVAAGHEDPRDPGVWKRVLFDRADLQPGGVQMINWARMPAGREFAAHYHEDMQEVFIILRGEAELTVGDDTVTLRAGDAVRIDPREAHQMANATDDDCDYLALGITADTGGRTVVVEPDR